MFLKTSLFSYALYATDSIFYSFCMIVNVHEEINQEAV